MWIIIFLLQLTNKDAIAQDFMLHDAVLRSKSALDQFASGLDVVKVLPLMRLFPGQFEKLFTYVSQGELVPEYFLELLRIPVNMNEEERRTAEMLKEFVHSSSSEGIDVCSCIVANSSQVQCRSWNTTLAV